MGKTDNVGGEMRQRVLKCPNRLAAIAPIAGWSEGNYDGCNIAQRKIPVWAFHGKLDTVVPYAQGVIVTGAVVAEAETLTGELLHLPSRFRFQDDIARSEKVAECTLGSVVSTHSVYATPGRG